MSGSYNLGTASGRIVVDGSGAQKGFAVAKSAAQSFFDSVNAEADRVGAFGAKLAAASAGGAAGFGVAINAASKFETRLSAISAVSGATQSEMDEIGEAALRIGAKTSFGATDAASAFEELIKAGISTRDAIDGAADATVAMAEAGEIALPRAAEIAAAAMNNFNLTAQDMPKVADTVAGAANASAIGVEDFAQSMNQVGSVANLVGLDFQDMAVAIAEMGNAGIKGSDAGTSLKTMLMNLQPKTKEQINLSKELGLLTFDAKDAMASLAKDGVKPASSSYEDITSATENYLSKQLNLKKGTKKLTEETEKYLMKNGGMQNAFFDSEGKIKSLADIQGVLQKSLKGMSEEQKIAALETLFGADAIRAAAIMADNGSEGYNKMAEAVGNVTAADVAAERMNNLGGAIENLKGAWETIAIKIGNVFLPVLTQVINGIADFLEWIGSASDGFFKWATTIAASGTALGGFVGVMIMLMAKAGPLLAIIIGIQRGFAAFNILKGAVGVFTSLAGSMSMIGRVGAALMFVFKSIVTSIFPFVNIFLKLRSVFLLFTGPVGIIIAAVTALVGAFLWAYNNIEGFRNAVNGVWNGIKVAAAAVANWFMATFVPMLTAAWNQVVIFAQVLWVQLQAVFASGVAMIQGFVQMILGAWNWMLPGLTAIFEVVKAIFMGVWTFIQGWWSVFGPALVAGLTAVWQTFVAILTVVWNTVKTVIMNALNIIKSVFDIFAALFTGNWSGMWQAILSLLQSVWNIIKAVIGGAIGVLKAIIMGGLNVIKAVWMSVWNSIKGFVIAVWNGIKTLIGGAVNGVKSTISNAMNATKVLWSAVWNTMKALVSAVWSAMKTVIGGAVNGVKSTISGAVNGIKALWSAGWNTIKSVLSNAWSSMKSAVSNGVSAVVNFFTGLPGKITGALGSLAGSLFNIGVNIIQGLMNGIKSMVGSAIQAAKDVGTNIMNGVKGVLGIHSPSREMKKIGGYIVDGLTIGIKETQKQAVDAMNSLAKKLIDTAQKNAEARDKLEKKLSDARKKYNRNSNDAYIKSIRAAQKRVDSAEKALAKKNSKGNRKRLADAKKSLKTAEKNRKNSLSKSSKKNLDNLRKAEKALRDHDKKYGNLSVKQAKKLADRIKAQTKTKKKSTDKDKTVADFVKSREKNVEKLKKVNEDLKAAKDAKAQQKKQVADNLVNEFSLGSLAQAAESQGQKLKFSDIASYASGVLARVSKFQGKLAALRKAGVHPALIEEVAGLGSKDGVVVADALLSGSKSQIKALSGTYGKIESQAQKAGETVAGAMHDVGIRALQGMANGLEDKGKIIDKAIKKLTDKTIKLTKKGFKVKSPSRRFRDEVGVFLPRGIAAGIDKEAPALKRAIDSMVTVPDVPQTGLSSLGIRPAGSNLGQTQPPAVVHENYEIVVQAVDTNNADLVAGKIVSVLKTQKRTNSAYAGSR